MRHRSVIAFILLAAILVAIPQASEDLLALKSALGERVRDEIRHAFLNLNVQDGGVQAAPQRAQATLASCPGGASKSAVQRAWGAKKGSAPEGSAAAQGGASRADSDSRGDELGQLAMMLNTPAGTSVEKSQLETIGGLKGLLMGKVLKVPSGNLSPVGELAMIIPPDDGIDVSSLDRRDSAQGKASKARGNRAAEIETRASFTAARFDVQHEVFRKQADAVRVQLNFDLKDAGAARIPAAAPRAKVTKIKRQQVRTVTAPVAGASGQAKQLACLVSEVSSWEAPLFSSGE